MMRQAFVLFALGLPAIAAAVPLQLSNQGYLEDELGAPLTGSHSLKFTLYGDANGTNPLWDETLTVDLDEGSYSVVLGTLAPIDEALLEQYPLYLGLSVDGGSDMLPRYEVVSAPYAILAETATNLVGGTVDASEVLVNGVPVVDADGTWLGENPPPGDLGCADGQTLVWNDASAVWVCVDAGGALEALQCADGDLARYDASTLSWVCSTESDPIFGASPAATIAGQDISEWDQAYLWGDHAAAGYLTSETDPVFGTSPASGISDAQVSSWDEAYGWGDHSVVGYLTSETDPAFTASAAAGITSTDLGNWNTAYGWGDHSAVGYLTSETDPTFSASPAAGITSTDLTNWNTAYGWGDHSTVGYLTFETDPTFTASPAAGITDLDVANWDEAHSWGDHAAGGYVADDLGVANDLTVTGNFTLDGGVFNMRRYDFSRDGGTIVTLTDWAGVATTFDLSTVADGATATNAEGTIGHYNALTGANSKLYLNIDTGGGIACMLLRNEDDAPRAIQYATDAGNGYNGVWGNTTTSTFIFEVEGDSGYAIAAWSGYVIVCM